MPYYKLFNFMIMKKKSKNTPKSRLVEIDGVTYLLIDGNLLRYEKLFQI